MPPLSSTRRQQRRSLLGQPVLPPAAAALTPSPRWGALRGRHQLLLSHRPGLSAAAAAGLVARIEASGAYVAASLPDHSMLLVGDAAAASRLQGDPDVVFVVRVRLAWVVPALHASPR
jgi:hypothetical protein